MFRVCSLLVFFFLNFTEVDPENSRKKAKNCDAPVELLMGFPIPTSQGCYVDWYRGVHGILVSLTGLGMSTLERLSFSADQLVCQKHLLSFWPL